MNEDFSELLNNFTNILKEKDIDINKIAGDTHSPAENTDTSSFSLDLDTILKIKNIISKINQNTDSPRNKLLLSLKPFLDNDKSEKVDKYIKIATMLTILEDDNLDIGLNILKSNKKGYDLILIITLFLLIF